MPTNIKVTIIKNDNNNIDNEIKNDTINGAEQLILSMIQWTFIQRRFIS